MNIIKKKKEKRKKKERESADWMSFQIHNFFNVYLQKILLIYTELWKKKVESKRNKYIEKKILTQVHQSQKMKKKLNK